MEDTYGQLISSLACENDKRIVLLVLDGLVGHSWIRSCELEGETEDCAPCCMGTLPCPYSWSEARIA